jgi:hypothetical protein
MAIISVVTRQRIKAYLEVFVEHLVERYRQASIPALTEPAQYLAQIAPSGNLKPFHIAILPSEVMRISAFERGFVTSLGTTFEECARLIASDVHRDAHRSYAITGVVSEGAINEINRQIERFERAAEAKVQRPGFEEMVNAVLAARRSDDLRPLTTRADLMIHTHEDRELYFELKSPTPNKGQCLEVLQRLLRFRLLRADHQAEAYFAMAYNPYGPARADYRWSIAKSYLPFDDILRIGDEFWTLIGGPTLYEELLLIYGEVGREKAKYILDALTLGF